MSSTRSSPPISPGCEDQNLSEGFITDESFKRPIPPEMRQQAFPPQFYNMYQPQLLLPNNSAFHRPDGGKSIPVSIILCIIKLDFNISTSLDSRFRSPSLKS